MNSSVNIICPACYSTNLEMYLRGLSSGLAGGTTMPAGNVRDNNMEFKCRDCGKVFEPADGKMQQTSTANIYPATDKDFVTPDKNKIMEISAAQGQIEAIKFCKEQYGWGLKEAKDYVDQLVSGKERDVSVQHVSIDVQDRHIAGIITQQGKLQAIKYMKDTTGMGLKEAKDYVERLSVTPKKEGCFIATACYGHYDAAEVLSLRKFRDQKLALTLSGRLLIRFYYKVSPGLARKISGSYRARYFIRTYLLSPLVRWLDK